MMTGDDMALSSEGELTVPFTQFPTEILQKVIDNGGAIPMLKITLNRVLLTNGLDLNGDGPMVIKFDFEAFEVQVEEAV